MNHPIIARRAALFLGLGATQMLSLWAVAATTPPISASAQGALDAQFGPGTAEMRPGYFNKGDSTNSTASQAGARKSQALYQPSQEDRILNLMRPLRVDEAALAPDGRHLAYVAADPNHVRLIIIDLDNPEFPASVEVGRGNGWQKIGGASQSAPSVTFLHWATARRLVFTEGSEGVYAVNADGNGLTKLVAPRDVGVPKEKDASVLAQSAPPGMVIPLNELDMLGSSPVEGQPVNLSGSNSWTVVSGMDPASHVSSSDSARLGAIGGNLPGGGSLFASPLPPSFYNTAMADPRSNSYINNGSGPDRATDETALLEPASSRTELPSELVPRTPRVVAMPLEDPDHIIVEAIGDSLSGFYTCGLYRVDIEKGSRVSLGEAKLPGHEVIYDRAGNLRIVLSAAGRNYFHAFPGKTLWRGARILDQLARDPADRAFQARPDTFFGAHSIPIGFDYDPDILYYASNLGRDTMGVYSLNLKNGERTAFAVESQDFDVVDPIAAGNPAGSVERSDPLVFDAYRRELAGVRLAGPSPSTHWLDSEIAQIQARLDGRFSGRTAKLLQWDERRTRFLVLVTGRTDPGRYYVYTPASEQILLCARRAPWIAGEDVSLTVPLSFAAGDGTPLTGTLTPARNARFHPAPLVVLCPDGPGQPIPPEFDRDAQAFAGMGYMVLRVNYRGTGGLGLKHLGAIRGGIDRVPLDDILAAIDSVRQRVPIDPDRIAVVGEGLGGYLALRAVQVHPERFRSAVSVDAPVDLRQWVHEPELIANSNERNNARATFQAISAEQNAGSPLELLDTLHATVNEPPTAPLMEDSPGTFIAKARLAFFSTDPQDLAAISPDRFPEGLMRPICIIQDETADSAYVVSATALRNAIRRRGGQVDFRTVHGHFADLDPRERANALSKINAFLNLDFYTYNVDVGPLKVIH